MLNSTSNHVSLKFSPATAWMAILGLVGLTSLALLLGAAKILNVAFPASALAVGLLLYARYPLLYIGFTWWLWFLTPLVRRLVDFQSGFIEPSPILIAPLLVTSITLITCLKKIPSSLRQDGFPFILCMIGLCYSFCIGLIQNNLISTIEDTLNWLAPLLFGFHLYLNWRSYPELRRILQHTFLWAVLLMGSYGLWQYWTAPGWDRFWLKQVAIATFGTPEPFGIRVWSTMHSPQPFASVLMAGLLLLFSGSGFSSNGGMRFLGAGTGYLAFLLTLARSAWLGWMVGVLVLLSSLSKRLQMRLIISALVFTIAIVPLVNMEPFATLISYRLNSLSTLQNDTSFRARSQGYSDVIADALVNPLGEGLGYVIKDQAIGSRDSGILSLLFCLGWLGGIPYLTGLLILLTKLMQGVGGRFDPFVSACRAIAIGTFAQIGLNVITAGPSGMVLWGFLGAGLAAHQYYQRPFTVADSL
jgi:hypothetical protein